MRRDPSLFAGGKLNNRGTVELRLRGSYPETAFEEVIEANRRGTWTINAPTGEVGIGPTSDTAPINGTTLG